MSLKHKGLEVRGDPGFTEGPDHRLDRNPVIVDGNRAVYDSFEIAVYLDEAYPSRPGLFEGTESRALGFFILTGRSGRCTRRSARSSWTSTSLHEEDRPYLRDRGGSALASERLPWTRRSVRGLPQLEPLRLALVQNGFVSGTGPGFTDYIVFGTFQWARSVSPLSCSLEADDPVYEWRERMLTSSDATRARREGYRSGPEGSPPCQGGFIRLLVGDFLEHVELLVDPASVCRAQSGRSSGRAWVDRGVAGGEGGAERFGVVLPLASSAASS